ncbi:MAG: hypothetical protein KF745_14065 [Phycisphaeraceae bacterium]|nr:hypothetical protein [Phycisphaeraceae bacterium]
MRARPAPMAAAAAALVLAAWWAFAPLGSVEPPETIAHAPEPSRPSKPTLIALDQAAFHAPLWVAPPPPPAPPSPPPAPPPEPPPPPMRLQLLAIVADGGGDSKSPTAGAPSLRAVLYDPDADRLLVLGQGEQATAGYTIDRVSERLVELRDARPPHAVRTLALDAEPKGARP